jgi:hypothetical protein
MQINAILQSRKIRVQTMWQLFGEQTDEIIEELNEALAA